MKKLICKIFGHKSKLRSAKVIGVPKEMKAQANSGIAIGRGMYISMRGPNHWPEDCVRCGNKIIVFSKI